MHGMHRPRPGRLPGFSYRGIHRYSLTLCTARRECRFSDTATVDHVLSLLRQQAMRRAFAVVAYCFMPDHLHVLAEGLSDGSDLRTSIPEFKKLSGHWHKRVIAAPLWQDGYYDRILRKEEDTRVVCRYILGNPVRKGLASMLGEYPFAGSDVYRIEDIVDQLTG